jgi:ribosomal protein S27AE
MNDGRRSACKRCERRYRRGRYNEPEVRAYRAKAGAKFRAAHRAELRAKDRAYARTPQRKAALAAYEKAHPEIKRAHDAVKRALAAGVLQRRPCERCGAGRALAHHPDYARRLDVRWLCPLHHKEAHRV